jgi:hypothetical protein
MLPPQDAAPPYQRHPQKHQGSHGKVRRSARGGHIPDAGAGYNVFGVAYVTLRRVLIPNGRRVLAFLADQALTRSPIIVGIQVVGVCAVLCIFPLCFSVGGEVNTIQVSATVSTATGVGIGLAGLTVVVPVEVVGIARVALQFRLGFSLTPKIAAGFIHAGIWRRPRNLPLASR